MASDFDVNFAFVPPAEVRAVLDKIAFRKPTPMLQGVKAGRDLFWSILSRRYLRARSRSDKKRLMRDTGTTAQSYHPKQSDKPGNIWASITSDYKVAAIHEADGPRLMTIRPKSAKALFVPLGLRSVSRGILPSTSAAGNSGLEAGKQFVFAKVTHPMRRQPSKHALKAHRGMIDKATVTTYEAEMVRRWERELPDWKAKDA